MGEKLIRPYEISVWEDKLTQIEDSNPAEYKFEETKLAIIGSDTMTGLNKVYDPVFHKKTNGEKTLSFALKYKYFDPYSGSDGVVNPFAALLVNERKVKLHYDGEWYEFIVKDHSESSDGLEWTYTCTDAFVLELSKNGYNITFDTELNNNQGTATELARETLKNTDWQVGESDTLTQLIAEPLYKATINGLVNVLDTDKPVDTESEDVSKRNPQDINYDNVSIWLFYSYVKNKNGKNVQFIIRDEENRQYTIDDKNVITDTNFRITTELEFKDDGFYYNDNQIISIGEVETRYQANRLAYNQLTTYDPVMQRTVDRFQTADGTVDIYRYTDYEYTTSNVLINYITNGENFNSLEDGTLQGWNPYTDQEDGALVNKLALVTKPEIGTGKSLAGINALSQIEGFLKYQPNGVGKEVGARIYNTVYNSGIENHTSFVNSIAKGDEFVFRWRAGTRNPQEPKYVASTDTELKASKTYYVRSGEEPYTYTKVENPAEESNPSALGWYEENKKSDVDCLVPEQRIELIVAKYTRDEASRYTYYYRHIDPKDIILKFTGTPEELNNYITGGTIETLQDGKQIYVIDRVAQTPSTKYIYKVDDTEYLWDGANQHFVERGTAGFTYLPYYYLTASATKPISNKILTDPTEKIGIFFYVTGYNTHTETDEESGTTKEVPNPIYIQDIQLTRFMPDPTEQDSDRPAVLGNVPKATSNPKEFYYVKPVDGAAAEDVETYRTPEALKEDHSELKSDIVPLYNENSEKTLTISASKSNCFNILQTIAETFECWVDLVVDHDDEGYITYSNDKPNKFVYLREYVGKENWAGFKYGINLNTIERTINSDEVVTKLLVDLSQSEYTDEGFVSIANAPSNQSGESYILNFDYYYSQGLLNRDEAEADKLNFIKQVSDLNTVLQNKEAERRNLEKSLTALNSNRNVFAELLSSAQDMQSQAQADFQNLTQMSYEEYQKKHGELIEEESKDTQKQLTDEQTIVDVIGELYTSSATINNYSGILTNVSTEYWNIRHQLYGNESYSVQVSTVIDDSTERHVIVEVSDYLPGFSFTLENDDTIHESTPSVRYFDIVSNATKITFTAPAPPAQPVRYRIIKHIEGEEDEVITTVDINDSKTESFIIEPEEKGGGLVDEIKQVQEAKDGLTNSFNNKYSRYIQEGTWNSTDYIDSELYYLDAMQVSNTSAQPTVSYSINVVEVSELEGLEDYKFDTGDKTYIEDTEFFGWSNKNGIRTPAREEVIVSEIEWHLDEPDQTVITVQNYKTRFEDLFQRINATVQTVQYNEATYAKTSSIIDADGTLNQTMLLESMNNISGQSYSLTSDGSVIIDEDRVLIRNLQNPENRVIINSEGIRVSSDGGQSWATAISGQGINIGTVYTGTLNTNNIVIGNRENPSFRWDKSGISAYKYDSEVYIPTSDITVDHAKQYYRYDETTGEYVPVDNPVVEDLDTYYEDTTAYDLQTYVRYDQYGLYGIKNNSKFKAESLDDVIDNAHFAVIWDGFFIKNDYKGGGRVEITSDNDFRVLKDIDGTGNETEVIKIGALEWNGSEVVDKDTAPTLYGIRIKGKNGVGNAFKADDQGNLEVTGTINANAGNFDGLVTVGKDDDPESTKPYIEIDGRSANDATIRSSRYTQDGASHGWMINADGDAVFNNITARGAIKTAVFEYAEIQAVGGIFIFRPSSTIKDAKKVGTDDVQVTLEKPHLFNVDDWCKVSNYINQAGEPQADAVLSDNGLTHVYRIKSIDQTNTRIMVLENAYAALTSGNTPIVSDITDLIGGALVDMGNKAKGDGVPGTNNYGIGINSSDNVVNLPRRAISLFETVIDETKSPKVSYNYRGILGTLPHMTSGVNTSIYQYMKDTQGIYTDNMYIGDNKQYVAFYEDGNGDKQLVIRANQIMFEAVDPDTHEPTGEYHDVSQIEAEGVPGPAGKDGEDAITVSIDSSAGTVFLNKQIITTLTCTVVQGNGTDITNQVSKFTWVKRNADGTIDTSWSRPLAGNTITLSEADVNSKAIFTCEVEF